MSTVDGFQTVEAESDGGALRAAFVPDANMLCPSLIHRGDELLHAGRGIAAYAEHGKTMGIPLLHPWANRLARPGYHAAGHDVTLPPPDGRYGTDPNGLPIHGALPGRLRWEAEAAGDIVTARLQWSAPDLLELFPFVHELALTARVTENSLQLATTLRATGPDAVPVSFGYHPYLRPPGSTPRTEWEVSLGARRRLVLDDHMIPTGETEPLAATDFRLGDQSFDDGLAELSDPPAFAVTAGDRTLRVTFTEGYAFAQVFAPPGQDFICFEPMTAPTNALDSGDHLIVVEPGSEHRAAFEIAVTDN